MILCLAGAPGVGKTSLAKSIANALGRKFVKFSLGGVRDEAEIRGFRRTYIGSTPGRIIQEMKQAGTNNPVFLLDEIDKLSNHRSDVGSALLEVLDPEQNTHFRDHYLELEYDLSNVMFVATANDLDSIPLPLLDRMDIIHLSSYTEAEKFEIAKRHLVAKQMEIHGLKENQLSFDDESLVDMIRFYTREAGVRYLQRLIAEICRKSARKLLSDQKQDKVPINRKNLSTVLKKRPYKHQLINQNNQVGVATGLAYTRIENTV